MFNRLFFTLLMGISSLVIAQEAQDFENFVDQTVNKAMEAWKIPAVSLAIFDQGSLKVMKGYGTLEDQSKVNEKSLFNIGSITKSFTSLALLNLTTQDGLKFSFDSKVVDILPDIKFYTDELTQKVTLSDLLCQRVGFDTHQGDHLSFYNLYKDDEILKRLRFINPVYIF